MEYLNREQLEWCEAHETETVELLKELGSIPAPSHNEHMRAEFIKDWFIKNGAVDAYIDDALNVIWPVGVKPDGPVAVLMAHTDIVFPDTERLELREENGCLYAPGIGDDTANLVTLMMAAKYIAEKKIVPEIGLLIVANSCEEGLGNLKGSKQIMKDFAGRITELISIDGNYDSVVNNAVGSCRMKITVHAQGGHSYGAFGNTNAIVQMAEIIGRLYEKEPPKKARTTYNVGVIEGGTTVNTICADCSMLYEYRSEDRDCLAEMDVFFNSVIDEFRGKGYNIDVEVLGIRPCKGDVNDELQAELTRRMQEMMHCFTGLEIGAGAGSTDANSALAEGVPSVTIGAIKGYGAHTRGEWLEIESLKPGLKIAMAAALQYFK